MRHRIKVSNLFKKCRAYRGFSLLELSIVMAIVSVVAVLGLEMANQLIARRAYSETQAKLERIDAAVMKFYKVHQRLPCAAYVSDNGIENGDCTILTWVIAKPVIFGDVPYATLNLQFEDTIDGYGNRINYVVSRQLALDPTTGGADNFNASPAAIEVRTGQLQQPCTTSCSVLADPYASPVTGAAYLIFSNGADGRGARNRVGNQAKPCYAASTDVRIDSQNCYRGSADLDVFSSRTSWENEALYYDSRHNPGLNPNNYFDDIVIWRTKGQVL